MSTRSRPRSAPVDSHAYAESLYGYAACRLDAFSLRCWIIRRLMFDLGLDHARAEELFERVYAAALNAGSARITREAHRRPHASIRELRRDRMLTQAELAARAGVTAACVANIERGERSGFWRTRRRIATALDAPVHQLFPTP